MLKLQNKAATSLAAALIATTLAGCFRNATLTLNTGIPLFAPTAAAAPEEKFTNIADVTTLEDIAAVVNFESPYKNKALDCSSTYLSYTSSDTNLVAATNALTLSGTFPDCTATLQPSANANGTTTIGLTFSYENKTVSTEFSLNVTPVEDTPVATYTTAPAFKEDAASIITLPYNDGDNDKATSCAISDLSNITQTAACSCDGLCIFSIFGADFFKIRGAAVEFAAQDAWRNFA
jgi:hypothetical protein